MIPHRSAITLALVSTHYHDQKTSCPELPLGAVLACSNQTRHTDSVTQSQVTCVYVHIHVYIHVYVHLYIHVYVHLYIHVHIHVYIHVYVHVYIHVLSFNLSVYVWQAPLSAFGASREHNYCYVQLLSYVCLIRSVLI